MNTEDRDRSLGDAATFAGSSKRRSADASLGDERTLDGGDAAGLDTEIDDIEVVDLAARYKTEGTLGRGGMGEVLLALDTRLDRKVAIKRILGEAARSKTAVSRFLTEAKAIAALNHPNVVQIYDYGRAADGPFLIMEYVDGSSLLDRCRDGALPLEQAVDLACQLCDGLAKAHDLGIVHRDIKPANVLLTKDGLPKLTDFGLAKAEATDHQMTMTGAVLGTPDFMPPEQRKDAALVDHRSDLWSLAATLYQMVTGRSPKIIRFDLLPPGLTSVLGKALEDGKDDRYQSAREFRDALRAATAGTVMSSAGTKAGRGELQDGECKSCGTIHSDASRKFCKKCGDSLRVACRKCDTLIPVWDTVCGECGGNQPRLAAYAEQVAEAGRHLSAFDYPSAVQALEGIPESDRDPHTVEMLTDCHSRQEESQQLIATIRDRIRTKELDGLLPIVERARQLRGDRSDLQTMLRQLTERRDRQVSRAQAAMDAGDAQSAAKALGGISAAELGSAGYQLFERVQESIFFESRLATAVKDAKADGTVTSAEAGVIMSFCEDCLSVNASNKFVQSLMEQCRRILDLRPQLTVSQANSITKKQSYGLVDVTWLAPEVAVALAATLAGHRWWLDLSGLKSLSLEAAEALATHKDRLILNGLTYLSRNVAKALSKHQDWLCLNGLSTMSDAVAEAFSRHAGKLEVDSVTEISAKAAALLGKKSGGLVLGIKDLSPTVARALATSEGVLALNKLPTLTDDVAELLAEHKGFLGLTGLTAINDQAAAAFAKHVGTLYLRGIKTLSNEAATSLSRHEGEINLEGLLSLSNNASKALRANPAITLPARLCK